jgi:hypothetical protein
VPIVHHQHVLVLPRLRLRSCRRPLHASPASGRYSLPHPVLDRLQAALAPAKNREAALVLAVFLARYWSAPARLGQAFPIDRRALCGHPELGLSEARVRGAVAALEEVGYLARIVPEPGRRYQPTADGLHRRPLVFHFGAEFEALFAAANKRPRRSFRAAQDGRRPLPASSVLAMRPRASWAPPEASANSPKNTLPNPTIVNLGELKKEHSRTSLALPVRGAPQRDLGLPSQRGQRRAQLVANVGEEPDPLLIGRGQPPIGLGEFGRALGDLKLQLALRPDQHGPLALELLRHHVEALGQKAELILAEIADPVPEIAALDGARAAGEGLDGSRDRPGEQETCDERRGDEGDDAGQRRRRHPAGEARHVGLDRQRLRPLVRDRRSDQALELRIEPVLDLRAEKRDRLVAAALLVEEKQPLDRPVDAAQQGLHAVDAIELDLFLFPVADNHALLQRDLLQIVERLAQLGAGAVEVRALWLADQQELGDLLREAVGVDRELRRSGELSLRGLETVEVVGASLKVDQGQGRHPGQRQGDHDLECSDTAFDAQRDTSGGRK